MQYDVQTPEQYLSVLEDDWRRETLLQLREKILRLGPDLEEVITYKMLGYNRVELPIFALNAQNSYVSLYIGDLTKVDPDGTLLKGLKTGKGCIRFSKTTKVQDTQIEAFIQRTLELVRSGHNVGCH